MATMLCHFWVVKLKTGYLSGDLAEALAASEEAIRGARAMGLSRTRASEANDT
jgi:hypothetical protein